MLEWGAVALALALPWVLWAWQTRVPRHKKNHVGFGLALSVESDEQAKRLRADFLDRLKARLMQAKAVYAFHFIEFPNHIAREVEDRDAAASLLDRAHGHFLIFGKAKKRILGGKSHHILELHGIVRHAPIAHEVSNRFSSEFSQVLPRNLHIAEENDLFSLDLTAQWLDVAVRYLVGVASLLSGDPQYSEDLFKGLEAELAPQGGDLPPSIAIVRNRLPQRIAEVYKLRINDLSVQYQLKRDRELLEAVEPWLDKLAEYDPRNYSSLLQRAICCFVLRRDLDGAKAALAKCQRNPDPTWRYSLAFLHAYEGDLEAAYGQYQRAFGRALDNPTVPLQSEEFIHLTLDEEPEKQQLYFCLGMINEIAKGDSAAALRDYELFLAGTSEEEYGHQHRMVRDWVRQLDSKLRRDPGAADSA